MDKRATVQNIGTSIDRQAGRLLIDAAIDRDFQVRIDCPRLGDFLEALGLKLATKVPQMAAGKDKQMIKARQKFGHLLNRGIDIAQYKKFATSHPCQ